MFVWVYGACACSNVWYLCVMFVHVNAHVYACLYIFVFLYLSMFSVRVECLLSLPCVSSSLCVSMSLSLSVYAYFRDCIFLYFCVCHYVCLWLCMSTYPYTSELHEWLHVFTSFDLGETGRAKKQEREWRFRWREHRKSQWKICRGSAWVIWMIHNLTFHGWRCRLHFLENPVSEKF